MSPAARGADEEIDQRAWNRILIDFPLRFQNQNDHGRQRAIRVVSTVVPRRIVPSERPDAGASSGVRTGARRVSCRERVGSLDEPLQVLRSMQVERGLYMKKFALVLALLSLAGAVSAGAETIVFNNSGPDSFQGTGAWEVGGPGNLGFFYSEDNSFTLTSTATINEIMAGVWVPTGTTLANVVGGIYTAPYAGGTAIISGSDLPASSILKASNVDGLYDIYEEFFVISDTTLGPGTYYLTFLGATTLASNNSTGNLVAWDWSANPNTSADGWDSNGDQFPGETSTTFALYGPSNNSPVPEPSSLFLLGSGAAALAGMIRRRVKA